MKQCFLCSNKHKTQNFTDEVFQKCSFYLKLRKFNGFKYKEIELKPQAQTEFGYHMECLRKFTAVKRKYIEAFEECETRKHLESLPSSSKDQQLLDIEVSAGSSAGTTQTFTPGPETRKHLESLLSSSKDQQLLDIEVSAGSSAGTTQTFTPGPETRKHLESLLSSSKDQQLLDIEVSAGSSAGTTQTFTPGPEIREHLESLPSSSKEHQLLDIDVSAGSSAGTTQTITLSPHTTEQLLSLIDEDDSQTNILTSRGKKERRRKETCIFCNKYEKKIGTRREYLKTCSDQVRASLLLLASSLNDEDLLTKINTSNRLLYHQCCWVTCRNKLRTSKEETSDWYSLRELHKKAFDSLSQYILSEILEAQNVIYLNDLWRYYQDLLSQFNEGRHDETKLKSYTSQHLRDKIESAFGDVLDVKKAISNNKIIIHKKKLKINKLLEEMLLHKSSQYTRIRDTAFKIRDEIKAIDKKKLPQKLHPDEIIEGECKVPEILYEFIKTVVKGLDVKKLSDRDKVKIMSICQDIIYITTKGQIKPSKQLMLGLTVKSLTNSSKLMTILNRYGHTISYTTAESLETELAFTAADERTLIPKSMTCDPKLHTNIAFDNFDRYVETLDGKDTMHDTVGIIYQFQPQEARSEQMAILEPQLRLASESTNRRRRKFQEVISEIQPYYKKPKAITKLSSLPDIFQLADECTKAKKNAMCRDMVWIFSLERIPETPMWTGFNCKNLNDNSEIQTLDYLPQINASPTSYSVVHQTMIFAEKALEETGQTHLVLTYDLAIAKMAMQIQVAESPKYDNLIINLGTFHIYLAFFKVLGKYIDGSGIEDILVQSQVLAAGSLNAFLAGKHYNRCKRIHGLLSAAFQILHFQQFLKNTYLRVEQIDQSLKDIQENKTGIREPLDLPPMVNHYLEEYEKYKKLTLDGEHGKTAQFCLQYTELVDCYHRLNRSMKTSDFYLYIETLFEIANLFFSFNQQNYARWLLKYLDNMLNMKKLKPEIVTEFEKGSFGVKRTKNPLARLPVDLTLEQTINADAANSMSGISHLTNTIAARQRWALTHSHRTKIITELLNLIDLNSKDDVSKELRPSKTKKDREDLNEIKNTITEKINPFDATLQDLVNISTGRAATNTTEKFLLNVRQIGEDQKNDFIKECNNDIQRFERPIKRNKIQNFSSECYKKTNTTKEGKQIQLKMERDIFGRLLAIALEKKIDMSECLSYPLAPLPPALCQVTGNMVKTDKSVLAKKIIGKIDHHQQPDNPNAWIIDGFSFLFSLGKSIPDTFGKLSDTILHKICNVPSQEIHIIFDRYMTPSIKDKERESRGEESIPYEISGPTQKTPRDFMKSLKNPKFKVALVGFLAENWGNIEKSNIIGLKKIFLTVENKCFSYKQTDDGVVKTEEEMFNCKHEEADTRIIFHIAQLEEKKEIVVNAADTDILIVILGNYHKFSDKKIFLLSGLKLRDVRYTDCYAIYIKLGTNICQALPALHAFTGCDYTASFFRQGKVKALNLLEKYSKFQTSFKNFNSALICNEKELSIIQEFTSMLYGVKNCNSVNSARYEIFNKTFAKERNKFLQKVKSFTSNLMPPCFKVLKQKIFRTIFVTTMWKNATLPDCTFNLHPNDYGWKLVNEKYEPHWFDGDPTPLDIDDIIIGSDDESSEVFTSSEDEDEDND